MHIFGIILLIIYVAGGIVSCWIYYRCNKLIYINETDFDHDDKLCDDLKYVLLGFALSWISAIVHGIVLISIFNLKNEKKKTFKC